MNWTDGFGTLIPVSREPVHLTGRRRPMGTEDFMLDKRMLKGKKIVLLDDLLTTGMTVLSVASLLRDAGLTPVAAVFVGRTIEKKVCQNSHLLFYAQSPDFHKLGLCYNLKILYL